MSPFDILVAVLAAAPCVGLLLLRRAEREAKPGDPGPTEAGESPALDCGCADRGVRYTCMDCDHSRCGFHRSHPHTCPGKPDLDGDLIAVDAPAIVAGEDASRAMRAQAALDFAAITAELSDLNDLDALAEFYLRPEVTQ